MRPSCSFLHLGLAVLLFVGFAPNAVAQPLPETVEEGRAPLSSSEVSDQEVASTAAILVALEQHRKKALKKYGNPESLKESERIEVQKKLLRERQALIQQKTIEEDLDSGRMELIMVSAQKDSVLNNRMHSALDKRRKNVKNHAGRDDGQ